MKDSPEQSRDRNPEKAAEEGAVRTIVAGGRPPVRGRQPHSTSLMIEGLINPLRLILIVGLSVFGVLVACTSPTATPPQPTLTPPQPTATPPWPQEVASKKWVLDHIIVNGQRQPPYSPYSNQTIEFSYDLRYVAHDGCNEIRCGGLAFSPAAGSTRERVERVCERTLQACVVKNVVTGEFTRITWDKPFGSALAAHTWSELREGDLYWHTSLADDTILVFRRATPER
jgi:hypothetical protein